MRKIAPFIILITLVLGCTPVNSIDDNIKIDTDELNSNLESYYTFNNGNADDLSHNGYNAIPINSPNYIESTPDEKGMAIFLNSIKEQYINIPYNVFLAKEEYSISFWIKDFSTGFILSAISNYHIGCDFPRLLANSDGTFTFYTGEDYDNRTKAFSYKYTSIQSSDWHHISLVCKKTGNNEALRYLYIDGRLVDKNEGIWSNKTSNECTKIQIGGNKEGVYSVSTSMKVDNVRFYSRCLSGYEIKYLYENKL